MMDVQESFRLLEIQEKSSICQSENNTEKSLENLDLETKYLSIGSTSPLPTLYSDWDYRQQDRAPQKNEGMERAKGDHISILDENGGVYQDIIQYY